MKDAYVAALPLVPALLPLVSGFWFPRGPGELVLSFLVGTEPCTPGAPTRESSKGSGREGGGGRCWTDGLGGDARGDAARVGLGGKGGGGAALGWRSSF